MEKTETKTEEKEQEQTEQEQSKKLEDKVDEQVAEELTEASKEFDKKIDEADEDNENQDEEEKSSEKTGDDKDTADSDKEADEKTSEKADAEKKSAEAGQEDGITDDLLERAVKSGLSITEARGFSSSNDLERTVSLLESRQTETNKSTDDKTEDGTDKADKPFDSGLSKDDYDEKIVDTINNLGQKVQDLTKENAELKESSKQAAERTESEAVAAHTAWYDNQIKELGEEFEDVFGKGTIKDIKEDSPQYKNRAALETEMMAIVKGKVATKQTVPPKEKVFEMALRNLHSEKLKQTSQKTTSEKLKKRASQTLGRGSKGQGSAETEIDKAKQANADFDKKID